MKYALLLATLASFGCSDPNSDMNQQPGTGDPNDPNSAKDLMTFGKMNVGGTRLKAKVLAGADGSKNYVGMYDTMLKTDCAYGWAEDLKMRCLPVSQEVQPYLGGYVSTPRGTYLQANCQGAKVAANNKALPSMPYIGESIASASYVPVSSTFRWFKLTEFSPGPAKVYVLSVNDTCVEDSVSVGDFTSLRYYTYDYTKPSPPTDFAEVSEVKLE